jgi:N-acetylglucosamine repressor
MVLQADSAIQRERYSLILRSILRYKKITRLDLCEILRLSSPALGKYVKALIDFGLIRETDTVGTKGSGRKSIYLELNPDASITIAIALHHTYIQAGLVTATGEVFEKRRYDCGSELDREEFIERIAEIIDDILGFVRTMPKPRRLIGLGVAMGGHLDQQTGISHDYKFAKNWYSVPLKEILEKRFDLPVSLVKDSNACALGEQYFGYGIGVDDFLSVWLGDGIGMGIVIDGKNYVGASGYAGELGHARGGDPSKLCYCGHMGCLEGTTSQEYILSECRKGLELGVLSEMNRMCGGDTARLTMQQVITAAQNGDSLSRSIFSNVGTTLGHALSDMANVFNPEMIILRGPIIDGNQFLFETIKTSVMNQVLNRISVGLDIKYSDCDEAIQLKGLCSVHLNSTMLALGEA